MPNTFEVGDVVKLKSGGKHMTVTSVFTHSGKAMAKCVWLEGTDQHEVGFLADALTVAELPTLEQ